jgi:hypothetical protein
MSFGEQIAAIDKAFLENALEKTKFPFPFSIFFILSAQIKKTPATHNSYPKVRLCGSSGF